MERTVQQICPHLYTVECWYVAFLCVTRAQLRVSLQYTIMVQDPNAPYHKIICSNWPHPQVKNLTSSSFLGWFQPKAKLFMKNIYALYLVLFCNRISFISLFQFSVRCFQIHCNGLFVCLMCVLLHIRTDLLDVRVIPPSRPGAGGSLLSFVIIIIVEICTLFREHSMVPEVQPHVCALAPVYHGRTIVFGCWFCWKLLQNEKWTK